MRSRTETLKSQMVVGSRILSSAGHDDFNQGQISGRLPGESTFLIKSGWAGFDACTAPDMLSCGLAPGAELPPSAPAETCLHQAIYQARPDVRGIVHTHHEAAVALGAVSDELLPISHEGAFFNQNVGVFFATSHTILAAHEADAVAAALGARPAVILRNHGFVTVGSSVKQATLLAVMFARACRIQLLAYSSQREVRLSAPSDIEKKRAFIYSDTALRGYWKNLVMSLATKGVSLEHGVDDGLDMAALSRVSERGSAQPR